MLRRRPISVVFSLVISLQVVAQSHSAFPVDVGSGPAPQVFTADGQSHLLYELRVTNFSASPIELLGLDVLGSDDAAPLASYRAEALDKLLFALGPTDGASNVRTIGGGRSVVIFLHLTLPSAKHPPAELHHRLLVSIARKKSGGDGTIEDTVNGPAVAVVQEPVTVGCAAARLRLGCLQRTLQRQSSSRFRAG